MASISEVSCASCVSLLDRPVGFWDAPQWRQQVIRELYVWSLNRWSQLNGYTLQLASPGQMSLAGLTVHETRSVHVSADILDIRDAIATLMVSVVLCAWFSMNSYITWYVILQLLRYGIL